MFADIDHDAHRLKALAENNQLNTGQKTEIIVADSKYGTLENYLFCNDEDIKAHFSPLEKTQKGTGRKKISPQSKPSLITVMMTHLYVLPESF